MHIPNLWWSAPQAVEPYELKIQHVHISNSQKSLFSNGNMLAINIQFFKAAVFYR